MTPEGRQTVDLRDWVQHKPDCAVLNPAVFDMTWSRREPPLYVEAKDCTCGLFAALKSQPDVTDQQIIARVVNWLRDELRAADAWQRGFSDNVARESADLLALLLADALPQVIETTEDTDTRMDRLSTSSVTSRTAASDVAEGARSMTPNQESNEAKKPYFWVDPNPSGASRELMTSDALAEFLRELPTYAVAGEGIEATLVFLTDAEVEALPDV